MKTKANYMTKVKKKDEKRAVKLKRNLLLKNKEIHELFTGRKCVEYKTQD